MPSILTDDNSKIVYNKTNMGTTKVRVPTTIEAFDAVMGQGKALEYAVQHYLYHDYNDPFRSAVAAKVAAHLGIEHQTVDGTADGASLTDTKFIGQCKALKDADGNPRLDDALLAQFVAEVNDSMPELAPIESKRGKGKASRDVQDAAQSIYDAIKSGTRTVEDFAAKWQAANPTKTVDECGDLNTLEGITEAVRLNALRITAEQREAARQQLAGL